MKFNRFSMIAMGIASALAMSFFAYGLYTDCPNTAIYEYCQQ